MANRKGNSVDRYYAYKERKRKARKVKLYAALILFAVIAFVVLSLTVFFNIKEFRVQGNKTYSTAQILAAAGVEKGDNLFRLNKFKIAEKLSEELPYIGSVEIYRKLPYTLCIDVQETKARLVAYYGGKYVLLDENLRVLEIRKDIPQGLTYLVGCAIQEPQVGQSAQFKEEFTFNTTKLLLEALYDQFEPEKVSAIDVSEQFELRVYYDAHRIKLLVGNTERLGDKFKMADNAITQNSTTVKARIDITDPATAYYKALEDEETDDPLLMLQGKAKAKKEKAYADLEAPEDEETEEENSDSTDEDE